jgi:pantoate--beta-alanine ligase
MRHTSATIPTIVRTVADLRRQVFEWRSANQRVALVPTMGALHEGHLSLVRLGRAHADRVVVSLFVNPTQFAPHEDFDAYPRNEAGDAALLGAEGCDLIFAPSVGAMYAPGAATTVTVAGVSAPMDGEARPHHFAGVATVVTKLLIQCLPDIAIFGEKDFQQLQVIRRLAIDLDLPVEIIGAPIRRDTDGLALSSRNAYLTADERPIAGRLNVILGDAVAALRAGDGIAEVERSGTQALKAAGFQSVDYFDVRVPESLEHLGPGPIDGPARVFVAARLGRTRLIDNMGV